MSTATDRPLLNGTAPEFLTLVNPDFVDPCGQCGSQNTVYASLLELSHLVPERIQELIREDFPCGDKGFGFFCHACKAEEFYTEEEIKGAVFLALRTRGA